MDEYYQERDDYEMSDYEKEIRLNAEVGRFVIEFEGMLHSVKQSIAYILEEKGLKDTRYADALIFDSTSSNLASYFRGIVYQYLMEKKKFFDKENYQCYQKAINKIGNLIQAAGSLRNDILHSSWQISSHYGANPKLSAVRPKITSTGLEIRKIDFSIGKLDSVSDCLYRLTRAIEAVTYNLQLTEDFEGRYGISGDEDIKMLNSIDFDKEGKEIFEVDSTYYDYLNPNL